MDGQESNPVTTGRARPSRRDRFWTFATTGVLVAASLGVWQSLRLLHQEYVTRVATEFAERIAAEIQWRLDDQRRATLRLARYWVRFGRQEYSEWRYDTVIYLEDNGLDGVSWIDPDFGDEVWEARVGEPMTPAREEDAAALADARRRSTSQRSEETVGPFLLRDGQYGTWIVVPVGKGGTDTLVASSRLQPMIEAIVDGHAEQCAVAVRGDDGLFYRKEVSDCTGRLQVSVPVTARDGKEWLLITRPRADLLGLAGALPHVVLIGGLLTAALMGTVMWTRGVTRSREEQLRVLNAELESRIQARTADLDEAVRESRAFNYSVSHDLRSPLGAVVNFAGILSEDKKDMLDEEGREHVSRIQNSAKRALEMLDGLLEFSRVARSDVRKTAFNPRDLVESAWNDLLAATGGSNAKLEIGPLPPVFADATLLQHALSNLLSNALKFSAGRRQPKISVGGRKENGRTEIWVRDNGVGFDMDKVDELFTVFSRLHPPSQFSGHGVGLAIVERIVRHHGGTIRAQGAPGAGAAFTVSLPDLT